jgi:hypothetical protein
MPLLVIPGCSKYGAGAAGSSDLGVASEEVIERSGALLNLDYFKIRIDLRRSGKHILQ